MNLYRSMGKFSSKMQYDKRSILLISVPFCFMKEFSVLLGFPFPTVSSEGIAELDIRNTSSLFIGECPVPDELPTHALRVRGMVTPYFAFSKVRLAV